MEWCRRCGMRLASARCVDCEALDAYTRARARWAESILGRPSGSDPVREVLLHLIEKAEARVEILLDGNHAVARVDTIHEPIVVPPLFAGEMLALLGLAERWQALVGPARVERLGYGRFRMVSL